MKEEDLRQEAYKECKKSQRKETIIVFATIAVAGTLSGCAFIPVYFWLGCGLGLFLIALACSFAHATWKRHQTELHAVAQGGQWPSMNLPCPEARSTASRNPFPPRWRGFWGWYG